MAEITAAQVKELREKTGAGMMDAKKALVECGGDMEEAMDFLRKKGLAKAAKKSSRTAAEGLVGLAVREKTGVLVELNSETDFVARNEQFQQFVSAVAVHAAENNIADLEALRNSAFRDGKTVAESVTELVATIGENMALRRFERLEVSEGVVAGYMHNAVAPGLGKIGVLVALESAGDRAALEAMGRQIAMHVAAAFPQFLDTGSVDPAAIERERNVLADQARESGKPEEIIEKMVEGRLRKFYEEVCLTEQVFVVDGETKISKVLENAAKGDVGAPVKLTAFSRYQLGEGIEKEETDFASEVAAAAANS